MKKIGRPTFYRIIESFYPHKTTYKVAQGILTFIVEVIRWFLQNLRGCWKHKFLKKRQSFEWRKNFGLIFLVSSSVKNLSGKTVFSRWQKILAQLSSYYRVWQSSRNNLQGSTRHFDNYCGRNRIIYVTPNKLLKLQFFETNATFQ